MKLNEINSVLSDLDDKVAYYQDLAENKLMEGVESYFEVEVQHLTVVDRGPIDTQYRITLVNNNAVDITALNENMFIVDVVYEGKTNEELKKYLEDY